MSVVPASAHQRSVSHTVEPQTQPEPENEDIDFSSFLSAVRSYDQDNTEVRTTAHSSSVTTDDWQKIQDSLR